MKFLAVTLLFIFTLGITFETTANEPEAVCTAETATNCAPKAVVHQTKTEHKDQAHEMNSLFPEKQKIASLSDTPKPVELTSPKFLAQTAGPVKLEWKTSKGANVYHVQVATDPNFKWIVTEEHFAKTNSFTFDKAEAGKRYYWRVAAFSSDNEPMYSKSNFSSSVFVAK